MADRPLTNARHEAFAQGIAKGMTLDAAYVEAGYKANRGNAVRLKANDSIAARIEMLVSAGAERAEVDVARVLKELVRLGTSDVRRLFDGNGDLLAIHEIDDDTAAAIASVEVVSKPGPPNADGSREVEHVHKFRMWDKNSALEKIARHLGMFTEKVEHSGPGGGPIQIEESPRDRIAGRLARLAARGNPEPDTGRSD